MFGQLGLPTERRDLQSLAVRCQAPLGAQQDRVAAAVETITTCTASWMERA